jgi:hypothetical protein
LHAPLDAVYCTEALEFRGSGDHVHCAAEYLSGAEKDMHGKLGLTAARRDLPSTPCAGAFGRVTQA